MNRLVKWWKDRKGHGLLLSVRNHFLAIGRDRRGQNTVEYLLMLTVVVGVVLVAGMALKKFMPTLFSQIQGMIGGAAGSLGGGGGF